MSAPASEGRGDVPRQYGSMAEYCTDLRLWMARVQQTRCMEAMFPIWLSQQLAAGSLPQQQQQQQPGVRFGFANQAAAPPPQEQQQQPQRGIEFRIPPLWKRLVAETVDFFILMIIKFLLAYIAIDQFGLIDLAKYDVDTLVKVASGGQADMSYTLAMEMTSELLMLEMVNRVSVCWFEALCLRCGAWGVPGGATPGKYLVGVRVVRCDWVAPSLDDHVVLAPGGDLGLARALLRSIIKNVSVTFFFPMFVTVFYLDHNRTPYDLLAGTIVVEPARR
ncbi:Protein FAM8A1 [Amphibalanus amphitrite]|uniref:Protein FAM8A1 n=1 Tax=Amphibalanus amphitrite TaxID=1232801 RepID=A0A6A4VT44_AMPAM|nr:protein FAM8A1-like [Amphibalanus amphitrite]XP_043225837.1 protein FAM8A1-like [Amphibalanus amphitrite]XP_043225838.1 protein FAM8A1-like [Amphibalanus amphitrite]KAF0299277.1 Protein FAM8A1 [Amphibalanus amphitrite]